MRRLVLMAVALVFASYAFLWSRLHTESSRRSPFPRTVLTRKTSHNGSARSLDCQPLLRGNRDAQRAARVRRGARQHLNQSYGQAYKATKEHVDQSYSQMPGGCEAFLQQRGYVLQVSEEEKAFPLAFSILMYKDVEQVERLLRAIYRPHNRYCVHVDSKSATDVVRAMTSIVSCLPGVFMAPRAVHVQWGEFGVLEAELVCMAALLRHPGWRYFINLTGQEFPLKTNLQIVRIVKLYGGANAVEAFVNSSEYRKRWKSAGDPPPGIRLAKGSTHVALTRQFVNFALSDVTARAFTSWLRNTQIPDETFFNSLNYSPELRPPGGYSGPFNVHFVGGLLRLKRWKSSGVCGGKFLRNICIFGVADLPALTNSAALFANKIHFDFQPLTLDCLEAWYFDNVRAEQEGKQLTINEDKYTGLLFSKYHFPLDTHPENTSSVMPSSGTGEMRA